VAAVAPCAQLFGQSAWRGGNRRRRRACSAAPCSRTLCSRTLCSRTLCSRTPRVREVLPLVARARGGLPRVASAQRGRRRPLRQQPATHVGCRPLRERGRGARKDQRAAGYERPKEPRELTLPALHPNQRSYSGTTRKRPTRAVGAKEGRRTATWGVPRRGTGPLAGGPAPTLPSTLGVRGLRSLATHHADVGQVAIVLSVIEPVTDHEDIVDGEAQVVDLGLAAGARRLVQQRAQPNAACAAGR
jgi:hypothetical protein